MRRKKTATDVSRSLPRNVERHADSRPHERPVTASHRQPTRLERLQIIPLKFLRFNTVREDVGAMCDYAGTGARVMSTPAWLIKPALAFFEAIKLSPLYKWVYGTADKDSFVSTEKIEKTLGWEPQYSNADALIRSYQWYLDHKHELETGTGVTHRIAWDQGILKLFKRFM